MYLRAFYHTLALTPALAAAPLTSFTGTWLRIFEKVWGCAVGVDCSGWDLGYGHFKAQDQGRFRACRLGFRVDRSRISGFGECKRNWKLQLRDWGLRLEASNESSRFWNVARLLPEFVAQAAIIIPRDAVMRAPFQDFRTF